MLLDEMGRPSLAGDSIPPGEIHEPPGKEWPRLSAEEVAIRGLVIIGIGVYDLARFAAKHPGGPVITPLLGTDATRHFAAAHAGNGKVLKVLSRFKIAELERDTLHREDRDMAALTDRLRAEGLFRYTWSWLLTDIAGVLVPFALTLVAARVSVPLAFVLFCVAILNQTYFSHDVRHDAVFRREQRGRRWVDALGVLVLGTTLNPLADDHRNHHAFTNQLGRDRALQIPKVVWHRRLVRVHGARWVRVQMLTWLGVILPMTFPFMMYRGTQYLLRERKYALLAAAALRWALLAWWFDNAALLLLPPMLVAAMQAFVSSLNHYHLRIAVTPEISQARTMIARSQNTGAGVVWTWLCGSLNFHIEHHLFPTMPRRNYERVAPEVVAFCQAHGIEYNVCTGREAVGRMLKKVWRPFRDGATSTAA